MAKKDFSALQNTINHLLLDFSLALRVPCYFYDMAGRQMGGCSYDSRSNFCRFVHFFDTNQVCRQSYLHNCIYAEEKKKPYTYYCPFGLINITYPILHEDLPPHFITVGPMLFSEPDDLMLNNILKLNYTLKPRYREIRQRLKEIEVKNETEVKAMFEVLDIAIQGLLSRASLHNSDNETKDSAKESVLQSVELWLETYGKENQLLTEVDLDISSNYLPQRKTSLLTDADLKKYTGEMADTIFTEKTFERMKYRAMKYVESLMALAQATGIHLETIFNTQYIDLEKIMQCNNTEDLSFLIGNMGDRFTQSYLSSKELTNKDIVFQAMDYIRAHYSNISLADVAGVVGLSPAYFSSLFKKETGLSFTNYVNRIRISESKRLLRQEGSIADIALMVGYSDQSYFSNVFRKCEGVTPKSWRDAHKD